MLKLTVIMNSWFDSPITTAFVRAISIKLSILRGKCYNIISVCLFLNNIFGLYFWKSAKLFLLKINVFGYFNIFHLHV